MLYTILLTVTKSFSHFVTACPPPPPLPMKRMKISAPKISCKLCNFMPHNNKLYFLQCSNTIFFTKVVIRGR